MNDERVKDQDITWLKIPRKKLVFVAVGIYVRHVFKFWIDHKRVVIRGNRLEAV